ncbi:protein JOKA2 isoform X1 [Pyrus x bretschneideri]|uniref:protein JOKA2 isoform X1 n=1 Tax=Pyrus x bretschneideri TaxID=225117 RepID=UPI00202F8D00|nr:protein JOKA2 isoform X1 [Pyrus x bretschneideri]
MASTKVIKVQYAETLRRFNASVNENDQLDLDMSGLREKILSLFNLHPDADITLAYVDEDGDVVTLVDDGDLRDTMRQKLKFLKIYVQINKDKSSKSSGSSTPLRSPQGQTPIPNFNADAAEVLKSLPEPLQEFASKFPLELASKAASSSPVLAELVDCFSKMGLSYLIPDAQVQTAGDSGKQSGASKSPVDPPAASKSNDMKGDGRSEPISAAEESSTKKGQATDSVNVTKDVGMSAPPLYATLDLNFLPTDSNLSGPTPVNDSPAGSSLHTSDARKESKELPNGLLNIQKKLHNKKPFGCGPSASSARPARNIHDMIGNRFNECPFTGTPIANDSATPAACRRIPFKRNHSEAMGGMFHTGVRCDGCGCHPIVGPRFKSVVKEDYDLCQICFASKGNATDYIRIDHPISHRHPRPFKGLYEQPPWLGPPVMPKILRGSMKQGRPKLDSRFVLDVNVMDGTFIAPSTPFTKIWRMRNNGGMVWPQGTTLVWIGGDRFSTSDSVEIEIPANGVPAENEIDIAVDFTAPESPGRYISYWRMATSSGQKFGQRVWVLIQVDTSLKDSFFESFQGLNLNLPPKESEKIDVNLQPAAGSDFLRPSGSSPLKEPVKPMPTELPGHDQELHFPINDSLLVGHSASAPTEPQGSSTLLYPTVEPQGSSAVLYPTVKPQGSSTVLYPTVNIFEPSLPSPKLSPVVNAPASSEGTSSNNAVEDTMLKELEAMGFKQVNLNKEVLRMNDYNMEQSVDDLCEVSDWDPILEELQEMGFCDAEMNKKLLVKNNGSIKRVVMDLINGEQL